MFPAHDSTKLDIGPALCDDAIARAAGQNVDTDDVEDRVAAVGDIGDVVADDGSPLPFQEVLRRFRRKHDVAKAREDVTVEFRAFDCLHAAGDDLLDEPLVHRHDRLKSVLGDAGAEAVSTLQQSDDSDEIAAVEAAALGAGHEGIMLKNPESAYTPGRRGKN